MSRRGWLLFAAMGVIWGIPYLLIKVADGGVSVPVLVCTRVALGSLLLLPAALRGGHLRALKGNVRWLAAFTAFEIVGPFALLSNAEKHLPSSTSGLLVAAVPIFSALLAWLTRACDRLTLIRWAGLAIGLGGVALLAGPSAGQVGPARATVITYVNPAVAVTLGVLVLGEHLTTAIGLSFVLILGGSVLATRAGSARNAPSAPAPEDTMMAGDTATTVRSD